MELLAKSEPRISLKEHIYDCLKIWEYLKICFPKAETIMHDIDFWEVVRLGVIFHDLGKAHIEFTKLLMGLANEWTGQRHELFSIPFIDGLEIDNSTKQLLMLVVAGHHRDFERLNRDYITNTYTSNKSDDEFGEDEMLVYEEEFDKVNVKGVHNLLDNEFHIRLNFYSIKSPKNLILSYLRKTNTGTS